MEYIDNETVMAWCKSCPSLETRISRNSNRSYMFCNNYHLPCFKCLEQCESRIRIETNKQCQKSLDGW